MMVQLTPATQHLQCSLYLFAQLQLTTCFSALELTGLETQSHSHCLVTICQAQCDWSGIAGCGISALPQTSPLGMKLDESLRVGKWLKFDPGMSNIHHHHSPSPSSVP